MAYRAIYKCRLCEEIYEGGATGSKELITKGTMELCITGHSSIVQFPSLLEPHYCSSGGVGIADFQGFSIKQGD